MVLIHTMHCDSCRPMRGVALAERFPGLPFVLAYMGNLWWEEAIEAASREENIYMDFISSVRGYDEIKQACDRVGDRKVLFGSDMTIFTPAFAIGMLLSSEIGDEERNNIFYANARMLLSRLGKE